MNKIPFPLANNTLSPLYHVSKVFFCSIFYYCTAPAYNLACPNRIFVLAMLYLGPCPWIHLKALVTGHQLCRVLLHSCLIIGIDRSTIQLLVVVHVVSTIKLFRSSLRAEFFLDGQDAF